MPKTANQVGLKIRPYREEDFPAVREIFCSTAYNGHSSFNFFDDGAWLAEAMLGYYVRFEPELCLVADCNNNVVGYLTGAKDSAVFQRLWTRKILPHLVYLFFRRGVFLQGRAWWFLVSGLRSFVRGEFDRPAEPAQEFPAHFHLNVRHSFQNRGIGQALVCTFLDLLKKQGVRGVHARTSRSRDEHAFFQKVDFSVISRNRLTLWKYLEPRFYYLITYGLSLEAPRSREDAPNA